MNKTNCRLCLKTVFDNIQTIKEVWKGTLNQLLHLNLNISKETATCNECAKTVQVLLDFKAALAFMKDRTIPLTNPNNGVEMNVEVAGRSNVEIVVESIDQVQCCFCTQNTGSDGFISLNESEENMILVDMLKEYVPELNCIATKELFTCTTCLDSLQSLLNSILNWLDVEQRINRYIEIEGTDANGFIELRDVQEFTSSTTLKYEIGRSGVTKMEKLVKDEPCDNDEMEPKAEIDKQESIITTEFITIKVEPHDFENIQDLPTDDNEEIPVNETEQKVYVDQSTHETSLEILKYQCEICTYKTNRKSSFVGHLLIHKNPSELTMHKCEMCKFETKHKSSLTVHMMVHKDPWDLTKFQCEMCTYVAKFKKHLKRHMWTHEKGSDVTMQKCEICGFQTRYSSDLNRHLLGHKNPSEVPSLKCDQCTYVTIHKKNLNRHLLKHKSKVSIEVKMYKCYTCKYETKEKSSLQRHVLTHKDPSEIIMHKCACCKFETKQKRYLKRHMLTHSNVSELSTYKCHLCSYKTKHKRSLMKHVLIHNKIV